MQMFEILLPLYTNSGDDYDDAHEAFRRKVLDTVGGFTELPDCHGFWMDGGKLYNDRVRPYHIACDVPVQWSRILDAAFALFPDQLSICHTRLGVARITSREAWQTVARARASQYTPEDAH